MSTPSIEYAVPAHFAPISSVYRDGALIVAPSQVRLPAGCVRCGEPEATELTKSLSWHHPAFYLLIFCPGSLLLYAIVAMIVRKRGTATFGLCATHARRRRRRLWIGGLGALLSISIGMIGLALAEQRTIARDAGPTCLVVGLFAMVCCLAVLIRSLPVLTPKRMDARQMRLSGAGARYLADLSRDVPIAPAV